jgi:site-specific recombinase XerD
MTSPDLAALVTGFFVRYLAAERNVSPHTTAAYRDTLKLLLRFASDSAHRPVTALRFEDLTPDLIRSFLDHLETARHNTVRTRNARLAAIHSFIRYVFDREPGLATICQRILTIPVKKTTRPVLGYLTDTELAHLLAQVDRSRPEGERDYLLLALLYDTGVRIQELLDVTPSDCRLASPPYVRIQGKGRRERLCPLLPQTARLISDFLMHTGRTPGERAPGAQSAW